MHPQVTKCFVVLAFDNVILLFPTSIVVLIAMSQFWNAHHMILLLYKAAQSMHVTPGLMIMASHRTFSGQNKYMSSQIKFGQTNLLYVRTLCTYQCFAPPPPMRENKGLNQGIIQKFCPQGRGISLANTKLLFSLLESFVTV